MKFSTFILLTSCNINVIFVLVIILSMTVLRVNLGKEVLKEMLVLEESRAGRDLVGYLERLDLKENAANEV